MAKETRTINGRVFNVSKIYRNEKHADGTVVKFEALALVPDVPDTVKTEDDYANFVATLVDEKVLTWKQIVSWTMKQIPILAGSVAFAAIGGKEKKTFTVAELPKIYAFLDQAKEALGNKKDDYGLLIDTMQQMYLRSIKADTSNWQAGDHVVMPSDINA